MLNYFRPHNGSARADVLSGLTVALALVTQAVAFAFLAGVSPLIFSWGPAWDEEHGLRSLVYNGQVLLTGTDDVSDMESWPSDKRFNLVWNRSLMTPAEIAAYDAYRRGHEGAGGE